MVEQVWPGVSVIAVDTVSGVSPMPMSDNECLAGARNRAKAAREALAAELGVGLEGGVNQEPAGLMLLGWVAIVDGNGREGVAATARLPLPPTIARRVIEGEELGPLMDELMGQDNVKQKGGAVGALTAGLIPRQEAFAIAVAYALAPFIAPEFYGP